MNEILEGVVTNVKGWHGSIDSQFSNIDNLTNILKAHINSWGVPNEMYTFLNDERTQLQTLINKCKTTSGSTADRSVRNTKLKLTVGYCLLDVKSWSYRQYIAGVLTSDDVHQMGFLLPGDRGGHHGRTEATDVIAEVKVGIINEDNIRVVIDQASVENAGQVVHGWPDGVNKALIVILNSDGKTEVYRQMTTHLHNNIRMPEGSHGKQFIIKAAFLKHVDDEPRFGNQPTFSMPLTTSDLVAALDRQHHEEFEAQIREVERQRLEIERLHAELKAKG